MLRIRRMGIDTYQEAVIYMRQDCHVCLSEGFEAQSRVEVVLADKRLIATLNVVATPLLGLDEVGLSEAAWHALGGKESDWIEVRHPEPIKSFSAVRAKMYGWPLADDDARAIIDDIVHGKYSDIYLAAFITAFAGERMAIPEIVSLTRAMLDAGNRLHWGRDPVVDKHCVGGLSEVAKDAGCPYTVLTKIRHGDHDVEVSVPDAQRLRGMTPVLVDDIVSTARTMIAAARHIQSAGLSPPVSLPVWTNSL